MIRLGSPSVTTADIAEVARVLASGFLVQGVEVAAFEADLRARVGSQHVIVMSNCTSALEVALRAYGIGAGDIVITSSYSWIATANVVETVGAKPIFVDIDPSTYNIDLDALTATVGRLKRSGELERVRALLPVHAFGYVADVNEIHAMALTMEVPVIEDAACALGASLEGRSAGTIGEVGCFSFHPRKSITSGEGGALVTDDNSVAEFARFYRNHGQGGGADHVFEIFGHNYRLTEPMAALGRSQLARLPDLIARRHAVIEVYLAELAGVVGLPVFDSKRHGGQAFVLLLPKDVNREKVRQSMLGKDVETGLGTIAIPFTKPYVEKYGFRNEDFPNLETVSRRALSLPLHSDMTVDDAKVVAISLLEAIKVRS